MIVVGDTTLAEMRPKLEAAFGGWKPGEPPKKNLAAVALPPKPVVYLIDRPGSQQSLILAGNPAPPRNNPDEIPIEAMNNILGGESSSRVNMNLRENKHWSYGSYTLLFGAVGQRPFLVYAPVETDKTKESLAEIAKELRGIRGDQPATAAELARVKNSETLRLPGSRETIGQVAGSIEQLVTYGLPDNYYDTYASKVREVSLADVAKAAAMVVQPDHMVWVVVGDRAKIEPGIRELGLGDVQVLAAE